MSTHVLRCMELCGGNEPVEETLEVAGMRVGVISTPYRDESGGGDVQYVSMCAGGRIS